jgi:hypothetical protein
VVTSTTVITASPAGKKKATCYYQGKSGFGFIGEFYALVGDLSSNNDSKI